MTDSPWMTGEALSERLGGIPEETLAYWRKVGKGPRWGKFGRHVRYRITDVEAWEEAQIRGEAS